MNRSTGEPRSLIIEATLLLVVHPTPTLTVDDNLLLRPVGAVHHSQFCIAFEESMPDVLQATPWFEPDEETPEQLLDYLREVEIMGRGGLLHHWAIIARGEQEESERFLGLVAFDRTTRTRYGAWNLGYWVRSDSTLRGVASRSVDRALEWLAGSQGAPFAVEVTVDPENKAGMQTAASICGRWQGRREQSGDGIVEVAGEKLHHITFLLPRLPLPHVEETSAHDANPPAEFNGRYVWLSMDTDDLCHHPKVTGHPKRSRSGDAVGAYQMSDTLASALEGFSSWREGAGKDIPVTLFTISEQLDDPRFAHRLSSLISEDSLLTVGCHGMHHRCWSAWPDDEQGFASMLDHACQRLASFAGVSWRPWFRAPGGYIAPWMAKPLADSGITLDSSVNPTPLLARKSGAGHDWRQVVDALREADVVERSWRTSLGLPVCGPALRIPLLSQFSRGRWRNSTRRAVCADDATLLNADQPVVALYWHLLDHARQGGRWSPPLHPSLQRVR